MRNGIDWEAFIAGAFGGLLVAGTLTVIGIGLIRTILRADAEIQQPYEDLKAREKQ